MNVEHRYQVAATMHALQNTAADNETKYRTEVAKILRNSFYLDGMLKSVSNEETAIKMMQGVEKTCADGDFHLTKFISNSKYVLPSIPEDERRKGVLEDLKFGMLPT